MKSLALWFISVYQLKLSSKKGFKCAYGQITGRWTCSSFGKKAISKYGFLKGLLLIRRQMQNCERLYINDDSYGEGCVQDVERCKRRNC